MSQPTTLASALPETDGAPVGSPVGWGERVAKRCADLREANRWREPRPFDAWGPVGTVGPGNRPVVSFASNDYLGLTTHPSVIEAAQMALARWGTGAGASRLVTGSRPVHHALEDALADWKGTERAVLFPSGYGANLGVLTTFAEPGVLVCSDELNHASIVDGARLARLARAEVAVYRHLDVEQLESRLSAHGGPAIVVSDLVFSMDGDLAPVGALAECCERHGALLVLDEAHAVLGPDPAPFLEDIDALRVGTLSKALGSLGGYVAASSRFAELLENVARSYIFTTALPPADAAAALAALEVLGTASGKELLERLRDHVDVVRPGHPSPIIPVVLGSEERALRASETLLEQGMWVPAIRPPSVAPGSARLRVTLSAAHGRNDVARLVEALAHLGDFQGPSIPPDQLAHAQAGAGSDIPTGGASIVGGSEKSHE